MSWKTIADDKVRHVWVCNDPECENNGKEIPIDPTFYKDSGNPMCECDIEMDYVRTEINA